jgi:uncharacterized lipoprotein YmbA
MNVRSTNFSRVAIAVVVLLLAAGCSLGGSSPPVHFYKVEPLVERDTGGSSTVRVGVGPVLVPRYLDRAGLVTRKRESEIGVSEYDRWAEPLDDMLATAIAENLVRLTGSDRIYAYPWPNEQHVDHRVFIRIVQFEIGTDGAAHLVCQWQLESTGASEPMVRRTELAVTPSSASPGPRVTALSETVATLSRQIAEAIKP